MLRDHIALRQLAAAVRLCHTIQQRSTTAHLHPRRPAHIAHVRSAAVVQYGHYHSLRAKPGAVSAQHLRICRAPARVPGAAAIHARHNSYVSPDKLSNEQYRGLMHHGGYLTPSGLMLHRLGSHFERWSCFADDRTLRLLGSRDADAAALAWQTLRRGINVGIGARLLAQNACAVFVGWLLSSTIGLDALQATAYGFAAAVVPSAHWIRQRYALMHDICRKSDPSMTESLHKAFEKYLERRPHAVQARAAAELPDALKSALERKPMQDGEKPVPVSTTLVANLHRYILDAVQAHGVPFVEAYISGSSAERELCRRRIRWSAVARAVVAALPACIWSYEGSLGVAAVLGTFWWVNIERGASCESELQALHWHLTHLQRREIMNLASLAQQQLAGKDNPDDDPGFRWSKKLFGNALSKRNNIENAVLASAFGALSFLPLSAGVLLGEVLHEQFGW